MPLLPGTGLISRLARAPSAAPWESRKGLPESPRVPGGTVTEAGLRNNVSVALQYLASWLDGNGAVAIFNLMEDAATAEISRSQVWQWVRAGRFDEAQVRREVEAVEAGREAKDLFAELALAPELVEFLTLPAYTRLE